MAVRGVSGSAVLTAFVGVVLTYSGIKNKKVTTSIRDLVAGKNPVTDPTTNPSILGGDSTNPLDMQTGGSPVDPTVGNTYAHASGGNPAANRALGKVLAAPFRWSTGAQWEALDWIFNEESGWNNRAVNPNGGATGIPQALPATKMPITAQAPLYDPTSQILWGLSYIKSRYGNPVNAKAFHLANGWY